jgi:hypothetical protein
MRPLYSRRQIIKQPTKYNSREVTSSGTSCCVCSSSSSSSTNSISTGSTGDGEQGADKSLQGGEGKIHIGEALKSLQTGDTEGTKMHAEAAEQTL